MTNWKSTTLADASNFEYMNGLWKGKTPPFKQAVVIRNTNFRNDGVLDLNDVAILDVEAKQLDRRQLQNGDIIIERSGGGPKQPVGRVCFFHTQDDRPHSFSNFTTVLRVRDPDTFLPRFVHYFLLHLYYTGYTVSLQHGTTGIRNLDFSSYQKAIVPKPPKSEQDKIAGVLWKIQRAIEVEAKLIATTRELKQSAMRRLFTQGLHGESQKETDIGSIPKSWQVSTLAQVATIERGRFLHRPRNEPRFYGGTMPFVQTGDVVRSQGRITDFSQTLNEQGVAISRVFPKGTILITIAANIGFTGVLNFDSACPDSLVGISPRENVDTWYLEYFLQTQQFEMDRLAPKGTQKNINIQFLKPWPVAVPSQEEQHGIADILQRIDRKISTHVRKHSTLRELFKTMLHHLMTGQIRVEKIDIDVSEIRL